MKEQLALIRQLLPDGVQLLHLRLVFEIYATILQILWLQDLNA